MTEDTQTQQQKLQILHSIDIDRNFEYEVERFGDLYIAGANDVGYGTGCLFGNVFLDKIIKIETEIWVPDRSLCHPFRKRKTYPLQRQRENQFTLRNVVLAHPCWSRRVDSREGFVTEFNNRLRQQQRSEMTYEDINVFFGQLYEHYDNQFKQGDKRQ